MTSMAHRGDVPSRDARRDERLLQTATAARSPKTFIAPNKRVRTSPTRSHPVPRVPVPRSHPAPLSGHRSGSLMTPAGPSAVIAWQWCPTSKSPGKRTVGLPWRRRAVVEVQDEEKDAIGMGLERWMVGLQRWIGKYL